MADKRQDTGNKEETRRLTQDERSNLVAARKKQFMAGPAGSSNRKIQDTLEAAGLLELVKIPGIGTVVNITQDGILALITGKAPK